MRSQSKLGIYKIDEIYVDERDFGNENIQYYIMTSCIVLGKYKTKERALEVLDEINKIKYYKYMAELDLESFLNGVLKEKPMEEQKLILSMLNTYIMPEE